MTRQDLDVAIDNYVAESTAALNAAIEDLSSRNRLLFSDNQALTQRVDDQSTQISVMAENEVRLMDEIKDLKARLEAYEPAPTTLMGVSLNGNVRNIYTDLHSAVAVSRVYAGNVRMWDQEDQHKVLPNSKWACSNTHDLSMTGLDQLLSSIPAEDKANIVAWCDVHEPEHPKKQLIAADYKRRMQQSAQIIRDHGLKVASCVMGFSIPNDQWLDWIDPTVVDLLAFDKYNAGAKKNPPIYQDVDKLVANMVEQSKRFGKPWALWETGTDVFGDDASRVAWTADLRQACEEAGAVQAIWFDRKSTDPTSDWTAVLQPKASAEAWLL